jgi:hypothetical protein
MSKKEIYGLS